MNATALAIAIAGLVTTALAPVLQGMVSSRNETRKWLREVRAAVYTDALARMQVTWQFAEVITWPYAERRDVPELEHADIITARMQLVAPSEVLRAWLEFVESDEALRFDLNENFVPDEVVPEDYARRVRLVQAIEDVRAQIQRTFPGRGHV